MFGLEPWALGLIAFALAMAGVVKGVIGIGLPIVTIVILSHFLDAHLVLAIVTLPILFTNLWQAVGSGSLLTPLKRFWPMILCLVLGIVFAAQLAAAVDTDVLYGLMGVSVVVFAVTSYIRPSGGLKETTERWAGPLAGAIGGILGGVSTIWGPPMMMYFLLLKLSKEDFIRAVGLVWFSGSLPLVASYVANGILTLETASLSALGCLPATLGLWLGGRLRGLIDQELFRKVLLLVLFLVGLNLIRRAVF